MRHNQPNAIKIARRGIVSVLAMLFMVLFAVLALGFYASVNTAVSIADNQRQQVQSRLAGESGMAFIKYHLANLDISGATQSDQLFSTVATQLGSRLNGKTNMGGNTVTLNAAGDTITIPGPSNAWITMDSNGGKFQITLTQMASGQQIRAKAIGELNGVSTTSGAQLDYAVAQEAAKIFNFGVASNGPITMSGNAKIQGLSDPTKGSVLSTITTTNAPIVSSGSTVISGDVSFVNPNANVSYSGNVSIAGSTNPTTWASHVHKGVTAPDFPTVDTSVFLPYATTNITGNPSGKTFSNIRIKANANPNFSGNCTLQGVVYIETPNKVSFSGNTTIQGVIVAQNNPTGNVTTNTLTFSGNVSASGPETLPASYGNLRNLTGSFILAPNFALTMSGNFGTVGGSIIVGQMTFSGNAGGTINGSVINMTNSATTISGNSTITINSQGTSNYPAGVFFGSHFSPLPFTYVEVSQ